MLEPIHMIEKASWRSSSTTPEPPAQPGQRERVGGLLRCSALCALWTPAMAGADHQTLAHGNRPDLPVAIGKDFRVCDHHSKSQLEPGIYMEQPNYKYQ